MRTVKNTAQKHHSGEGTQPGRSRSTGKTGSRPARSPGHRVCEAGCSKQNEQAQRTGALSGKPGSSWSKLSYAIQQFYSNLSSMPLDVLISHAHPQQWLQEQLETCRQLEDKLVRLTSKQAKSPASSTHNSSAQAQSYHYYQQKIAVIRNLLGNISNNMEMLRGMHQQELNHPSTQRSPLSSSSRYESNAGLSHELGSSHQSSHQSSLENSPPELPAKPSKWELLQRKFTKQHSHYQIGSAEPTSEGQIIDAKTLQLSGSFNRSQGRRARQCEEEMQMLSTCRTEEDETRGPAKTRAYNHYESIQEQRQDEEELEATKGRDGGKRGKRSQKVKSEMTNVSQMMAISQIQGPTTMLKSMNRQGEQEKAYQNLDRTERNPRKLSLQDIRPLVQQLNQTKAELAQKNRQIEKLLIKLQEYQSIVQLFKTQGQQLKESNRLASERISNLESLAAKQTREIELLRASEAQLKQTLATQAATLSAVYQQKKDISDQLQATQSKMAQLAQELQLAREKQEQLLTQSQKREKIAVEKMEIYRHKYHNLLHESELRKVLVKESYGCRAAKVNEIWQILAQHRQDINAVDGQSSAKLGTEQKQRGRNKRSISQKYSIPVSDSEDEDEEQEGDQQRWAQQRGQIQREKAGEWENKPLKSINRSCSHNLSEYTLTQK